jgi:hypothetical protein
MHPRGIRLAMALVTLAAATGCAAGPTNDVRATSQEFHHALAVRDWSSACDLLAPPTKRELEDSSGKPCATALRAEHLVPARSFSRVTVFGDTAQVRTGVEAEFLARYDEGWRVLASGCAPAGHEKPRICRLQGG